MQGLPPPSSKNSDGLASGIDGETYFNITLQVDDEHHDIISEKVLAVAEYVIHQRLHLLYDHQTVRSFRIICYNLQPGKLSKQQSIQVYLQTN